MPKSQRNTARKPATKFAHLTKKMQKAKAAAHTVKIKKK